ncbi:MAG: amidase domain-containing protein [Polyangiaceae bacterium]
MSALVLGCHPVDDSVDSVDESADEENVDVAHSALTVTSYEGHYAATYAWAWKNDKNALFVDATNWNYGQWSGGDCTNFANQAILAGLKKSWQKSDVFNATATFKDQVDPNNWWWYNGTTNPHTMAEPQWRGANGLYVYLSTQALHPTWAGIRLKHVVINGSKSTAAANMKLGNVVIWTMGGSGYHSMIVSAVSSDPNWHELSYRNGPGYSPASKLVKDLNPAAGTKWNVFNITGFAK